MICQDLPKIGRALVSMIISWKRKKYRRDEGLSTAEGVMNDNYDARLATIRIPGAKLTG